MALLQFKPAPMYILDEIDAALDLSHTQHIGTLFRNRFRGSQFVVVSLKEGLFTNANVLFRTRFRDNTSVVEVSRPANVIVAYAKYICHSERHRDRRRPCIMARRRQVALGGHKMEEQGGSLLGRSLGKRKLLLYHCWNLVLLVA